MREFFGEGVASWGTRSNPDQFCQASERESRNPEGGPKLLASMRDGHHFLNDAIAGPSKDTTMLTVWVRRTPHHEFCHGVLFGCFAIFPFAFCSCLFIFCF
jgi:hypothetical protein